MEKSCGICKLIQDLQGNLAPFLIKEMETGYAMISRYQYYKGYTLFLCKYHKTELHLLKPEIKKMFLEEMATVAESVYKAVKPAKLNYELLGNTEAHLHWHLIPR